MSVRAQIFQDSVVSCPDIFFPASAAKLAHHHTNINSITLCRRSLGDEIKIIIAEANTGYTCRMYQFSCVYFQVMHDCCNTATNLFRQFGVKLFNVFDTSVSLLLQIVRARLYHK